MSVKSRRKNSGRTLRLETLENREMLSVSTWDAPAADDSNIVCICGHGELDDVLALDETTLMGSAETAVARNAAVSKSLLDNGQDPDNISLDFVFNLSSAPNASLTIYIDFDGSVTEGTSWNAGGRSVVTPAYDCDGDVYSFSNEELRNIYEIWLRVAEDYAPFDVNVTTVEPSSDKLIKSDANDAEYGIRVNVGGSCHDWLGSSCCGIAVFGSFTADSDTPCFAFANSGSGYYSPSVVGDSVAHEVGHALGLSHDGTSSAEYYFGHENWGAIMGGAGNRDLVQWSNGAYPGASNQEDDLSIITNRNGVNVKADDYGDAFASAQSLLLTQGALVASGLIERNDDVDFFTFNHNGSVNRLTVGGLDGITNLDVLVKVYDANRNLVLTANPTDSLSATINLVDLPTGKYYLSVEGTGSSEPGVTGYTSYGSLGAYTIQTDSVLLVASVSDDASASGLTLRQAIARAAEGDVVAFDSSLAGQTIELKSGPLVLAAGITIDASDAPGLVVKAKSGARVFEILGGTTESPVKLEGLAITGGAASYGAGIYLDGEAILEDCVVLGNAASNYAGGIYVGRLASLTVANSKISGNVAGSTGNDSSCHGGGLYVDGTLTIVNSELSDNSVLSSSAAGYASGGALSVGAGTWTANGVATHYQGTVTMENCLLTGNLVSAKSAYGGAFDNYGDVSITNVTITRNTANGTNSCVGGGICNWNDLSAWNSVVADNTAIQGEWNISTYYKDLHSASAAKGTNNLSSYTGWSGSNNYQYGANLPLFTNAAAGDFTLADGSQALDRGDSSKTTRQYDLAGNFRVQGANVDLGAYEHDASILAGSVVVDAYDPNAKSATLSWNALEGAHTYLLQISADGGKSWTDLPAGQVAAKLAVVNNLEVGNLYTFRVRAFNANGAPLPQYYERVFRPIDAAADADQLAVGVPVNIEISPAVATVGVTVKWYKVTANGAVEITAAANKLSYTPTSAANDLKIVVSGTGDSAGCVCELDVLRPANVQRLLVASYNDAGETAYFSWNALDSAASYELLLSTDGGQTWTSRAAGITAANAGIAGIAAGASYTVKVVGTDANGQTVRDYALGTFVPFKVTASAAQYAIGTPVSITVTAASGAQTSINWYAANPSGDVEITAARGKKQYTPTSGEYDVKVVVMGTGVSAGCSAAITIAKPDAEVEPGVLTVSGYDAAARQATVSWEPMEGATSYTIQISRDSGATWSNLVSGIRTTTKAVTGLYAGRTYGLRVIGKSASGATLENYLERTFAPISVACKTTTYEPGTTITLSKTAASNASMTINWYKETPNGDVEIASSRNALSYKPKVADYDLKVVVTGTGDSEGCETTFRFTRPATVGTVSVLGYDQTTGTASLEWDTISGAAGYDLLVSADSGATWTTAAAGLTTTRGEAQNLAPGVAYMIKVAAKDASGLTSADYNETTFAPIAITANTRQYEKGESVGVTITGANPNQTTIQWFLMTPNGPMELTEAANQWTFTPDFQNYDLKVVATGTGASAGCVVETTITAAPALGEVTLNKYNSGSHQALLQWNEVADAVSYKLLISKDGGKTWLTYANTVNKNSAAVNGIYARSSYQFKALARMADKSYSESYSFGVIEPINLVTNGKPYVTSTAKQVTIQCATPPNVDLRWYYVTDNGDVEITDAHNQTSYKITTTDYELKVVGIGSGASAGFTSTVNIPRPNKKITATTLTSSKSTLTWQPLPGAVTYAVKRSTDGGETWVTYKKDIASTTCEASGLYAGKTYMFTVTGYDATGKPMLSVASGTVDKAASAAIVDDAFADFFGDEFGAEL